MPIHCSTLNTSNSDPVPVFASRFPHHYVLSAFGWPLGLDHKAPVVTSDAAVAILIGPVICGVAALWNAEDVNIYVLLLRTITALGPFIVFLTKIINDRISISGFTVTGLLICSSGVLKVIFTIYRFKPAEKHYGRK